MKHLFVLLLVLLFSGCSVTQVDTPTKVVDVNTTKAVDTSSEIVCNSPYIRFGSGCCLDKNSNSVCDSDEKAQVSVPASVVNPFSVSFNVVKDSILQNDSAKFNVSIVNNKDPYVRVDVYFPSDDLFVFGTDPSFFGDKGVNLAPHRSVSFFVMIKSKPSTPLGVYSEEISVIRGDTNEKIPLVFPVSVISAFSSLEFVSNLACSDSVVSFNLTNVGNKRLDSSKMVLRVGSTNFVPRCDPLVLEPGVSSFCQRQSLTDIGGDVSVKVDATVDGKVYSYSNVVSC